MNDAVALEESDQRPNHARPLGQVAQAILISTMAFLTVVDLFATQALLPMLAKHYDVKPAAMGLAVNVCTLGMAIGGLLIALSGQHIDRRRGIVASLLMLSIPTLLLAYAPDLWVFGALRIAQGLCMASAFGLTLAHLGESFMPEQTANAFAAYITGNVASNLIGRLIAVAVVDHGGLAFNFAVFAVLNISGAMLAYIAIRAAASQKSPAQSAKEMKDVWSDHLRQPEMRAAFAIGFCILFAFIGTFTYVNFVLVAPPLAVGMMSLGLIYLVFLPSIATTLLAGPVGRHIGHQRALQLGLYTALFGSPLLLIPSLPLVLIGMTLVATGTFFAQALATGFIGRAAKHSRAAASGLYLASYFSGGLIGSAVLGQLFDSFGWAACIAGIATALVVAATLSLQLTVRND